MTSFFQKCVKIETDPNGNPAREDCSETIVGKEEADFDENEFSEKFKEWSEEQKMIKTLTFMLKNSFN